MSQTRFTKCSIYCIQFYKKIPEGGQVSCVPCPLSADIPCGVTHAYC